MWKKLTSAKVMPVSAITPKPNQLVTAQSPTVSQKLSELECVSGGLQTAKQNAAKTTSLVDIDRGGNVNKNKCTKLQFIQVLTAKCSD